MEIVNQSGQLIRQLFNGINLDQGSYRFRWDGTNGNGQVVAPGIYHLRMVAGETQTFVKLVKTE